MLSRITLSGALCIPEVLTPEQFSFHFRYPNESAPLTVGGMAENRGTTCRISEAARGLGISAEWLRAGGWRVRSCGAGHLLGTFQDAIAKVGGRRCLKWWCGAEGLRGVRRAGGDGLPRGLRGSHEGHALGQRGRDLRRPTLQALETVALRSRTAGSPPWTRVPGTDPWVSRRITTSTSDGCRRRAASSSPTGPSGSPARTTSSSASASRCRA